MRAGSIIVCVSLVLMNFQFPIDAFSNTDGPTFPLEVSTDKYYYTQGEEVVVTLTNVGDKTIDFLNPPGVQVKNSTGHIIVNQCPSVAQVVIPLAADESLTRRWDQEHFLCSHPGDPVPPDGEQVAPGRYNLIAGSGNARYAGEKRAVADTVWIEIGPAGGAPVADAGPDQTVYVGDTVHFNGSGSHSTIGEAIPIGANMMINDVKVLEGVGGIPRVALDSDGGSYVTWTDTRKEGGVFFDYASNLGTFGPDKKVGEYFSGWSDISLSTNDDIHIAWVQTDILYSVSTDGGLTFSTPVVISEEDTPPGYPVRIDAGTDRSIHVVWGNSKGKVCYRSSSNGGGNWNQSLAIADGGFPDVAISENESVYVTWQGLAEGSENASILFSRRNPNGSFEPAVTPHPIESFYHINPSIAVGPNDEIYIAWVEFGNGEYRIAATRSLNGGLSFETPNIIRSVKPAEYPGIMRLFDVAATTFSSAGVAIAWAEYMQPFDPGAEIRVSISLDRGESFGAYRQVDDLRQSGKRMVAIDGNSKGDIYVAWHDGRDCRNLGLCGSNIYGTWVKVSSAPLRFDWDFGDGSNHSVEMNPTHIYSNSGDYNVALTVTDDRGVTDSDYCIITVLSEDQPPVADAGADQIVFEGDALQFNGSGSHDPDGGTYGWEVLSNMSVPRMNLAAAAIGQEIYAIGGFLGDEGTGPGGSELVVNTVEVYDASQDLWAYGTPLPSNRSNLGAATVSGKIYAIGGRRDVEIMPPGVSDLNDEYDPATDEWKAKARMPTARASFGTAVVDDKIFVIGGFHYYEMGMYKPLNTTEVYDPATDSWSTRFPMPTNRSFLALAVLDRKIYAIGGYPTSSLVEIYDVDTDTWTTGTEIPPGLLARGITAEALAGRIYVMGGYSIDCVLSSVISYDPLTDQWQREPLMNHPRIRSASVTIGNAIYVVGGTYGWMCGNPNPAEKFEATDNLTYEWDFHAGEDLDGDGNYVNDKEATGPTPTHIYYDDGVFTVTLTVTDSQGAQGLDQCNITVYNVPPTPEWTSQSVDGTILNPPYPEGKAVLFEATVYDPGIYDTFTYDWDFGDGTILLDAGPLVTHTYGDNDTYIVVLKVTDDDGGVGIDDTPPLLTTNEDPAASISLPRCPFFEGRSCPMEGYFTDLGWLDTHSASWNFGDGEYEIATITEENEPPDATGKNRTVHIYGDDGDYNITFTVVDDDGGSDTAWAKPYVLNLPPSLVVDVPSSVDEGEQINLGIKATDPGSDDIIINIDWGDGTSEVETFYNDGIGPDPPNSGPGVYPFTIHANFSHLYGDNGNFNVTVKAEDDDGGLTTNATTVTVNNVAPMIAPFGPFTIDEGLELVLDATSTDPGSDDLTFIWQFELGPTMTNTYYNDGVGSDPYPSPGGTYPFTVTDSVQHTYGDNGVFNITLTVEDDDGGTASYTTTITVNNVAPTISPFGPFTVDEGSALDIYAMSTDPGSDDLMFTWELELGPIVTNTYYNDGLGPDPYPSPGGTYPFTIADIVRHTYGDNAVFNVTLTVEDDDGGTTSYATTITVDNVAPTVDVQAYVLANFTLRIAGEKWHNVEMFIYVDDEEISYAEVVRYPGNPDEQTASTGYIKCDITEMVTARVLYTPEDDPVNGQINGATPVWLTLTFEDGSEIRLKHTFNVQHPDTWEWNVNINPYFVGHEITFEATATDPGSDDLTFTWNWGDGSPDNETTYYNDGMGPDPYPSPGGTYPFSAKDMKKHTFTASGVHTVTLTIEDDDGGVGIVILDILIP